MHSTALLFFYIILCNITSIAYDQYTDIYSLININIYIYIYIILMQECVDALRDEIQHEQNNGNNGAVSSGAAGVTTIGFGNPTAGASSSSSPSLSSSSSSPRPGGLAGAVPNVFNFSFPQATATGMSKSTFKTEGYIALYCRHLISCRVVH